MRWLLTTRHGIEPAELQRELEPLGVRVELTAPIPLGDEQVVEAEGPDDLPARLEGRTSLVRHVHPDSGIEPYG